MKQNINDIKTNIMNIVSDTFIETQMNFKRLLHWKLRGGLDFAYYSPNTLN
jgi:hypothetical protein